MQLTRELIRSIYPHERLVKIRASLIGLLTISLNHIYDYYYGDLCVTSSVFRHYLKLFVPYLKILLCNHTDK